MKDTFEFNVLLALPYFVVLVLVLLGINVFVVLLIGSIAAICHDHQFNWWFGDAPERSGLLAPPKGGVESTILAASQGGYFSVLLSL